VRSTRDKVPNNIKMNLKQVGGRLWTGLIWRMTETSGGHAHINGFLSYIKFKKFFD
jgi:hypothetical protein